VTEPRENGPMDGDDELAALGGLDLALDGLAAGRDLPGGEAAGEAAALAALAADLRSAMPAPPPEAADRGRAAFLAAAAGGRPRGAAWRRSLPLRLAAVAAALIVLVALPAAARQADPGTALWPVRSVGQQVRDRLAGDPVDRARLRLNTAEDFLVAAAAADEERREDMADAAEERIEDALEVLKGLSGPEVAAVRAWAGRLEARVETLERQKDTGDRSGSGGETEAGDDPSDPGGDDRSRPDEGAEPGDDDRSGSGGGDDSGGSGSGQGSSGSGSGLGASRSGSGDG
jgi:uncharacterized membrane protein YgcG